MICDRKGYIHVYMSHFSALMSLVSNLVEATVPEELPIWMDDVDKSDVYSKTSQDIEFGPKFIDTGGADLTDEEEKFLVYKNAQRLSEQIRAKKKLVWKNCTCIPTTKLHLLEQVV